MQFQWSNNDDSSIGEIERGLVGVCGGWWSGVLGRLLLACGSIIFAMEIYMRFCSDNKVGLILSPHIESKMGKIFKKTLLQRIIEDGIWRTVE